MLCFLILLDAPDRLIKPGEKKMDRVLARRADAEKTLREEHGNSIRWHNHSLGWCLGMGWLFYSLFLSLINNDFLTIKTLAFSIQANFTIESTAELKRGGYEVKWEEKKRKTNFKKLGWEGERLTTMVQMTALLQNFSVENQSPVWRHEEVGPSGRDYFLSVEPLLMEFVVLERLE